MREKADAALHYQYLEHRVPAQTLLPSPGEAVGNLVCVSKHNSLTLSVQADKTVRSLWAQPSVGGAQVVAAVLSNPAHAAEW